MIQTRKTSELFSPSLKLSVGVSKRDQVRRVVFDDDHIPSSRRVEKTNLELEHPARPPYAERVLTNDPASIAIKKVYRRHEVFLKDTTHHHLHNFPISISLAVGAVVSYCGVIGFIGLLIPHFIRPRKGVVRWRLKYSLSLRNLSEMMLERGFEFTHEAVRSWEERYTPLITQYLRRRRRGTLSLLADLYV